MIPLRVACSWSGGKDSCFALMNALAIGHTPAVVLNVLNEEGQISRSHGIPADILHAQATAMGLPMELISSSWADYEAKFIKALKHLKHIYTLDAMVFGDIDLQAHRDWEEKVCADAGIEAILPLWRQDRKTLVEQMLEQGIRCMIVSCNEKMGESFLGKFLTLDLLPELEKLGVDVCGENGEFHTLVLDCPLFQQPIQVEVTEKLHHGNYWFCRMENTTTIGIQNLQIF